MISDPNSTSTVITVVRYATPSELCSALRNGREPEDHQEQDQEPGTVHSDPDPEHVHQLDRSRGATCCNGGTGGRRDRRRYRIHRRTRMTSAIERLRDRTAELSDLRQRRAAARLGPADDDARAGQRRPRRGAWPRSSGCGTTCSSPTRRAAARRGAHVARRGRSRFRRAPAWCAVTRATSREGRPRADRARRRDGTGRLARPGGVGQGAREFGLRVVRAVPRAELRARPPLRGLLRGLRVPL